MSRKLSRRKLRNELNEIMLMYGHTPYDYNIAVDLNLTLDLSSILSNLDLSKLIKAGPKFLSEKGIIKKASIKPGTETKEQVDATALDSETLPVNNTTTGNLEVDADQVKKKKIE